MQRPKKPWLFGSQLRTSKRKKFARIESPDQALQLAQLASVNAQWTAAIYAENEATLHHAFLQWRLRAILKTCASFLRALFFGRTRSL